jgi:hypothetical protein
MKLLVWCWRAILRAALRALISQEGCICLASSPAPAHLWVYYKSARQGRSGEATSMLARAREKGVWRTGILDAI